MKLKVLQPMAQEDGKYMEWYRPESEDSNVLWSFVLHLRQEMYETNKSTKVTKYWAIYALRRKHPGKRKQNKHGLSWQSKHDAAESSKVETMTKFTNSHESQLPRDHKFHAFILFRCLKWLADLTDQKDHTSATPGLDVSKVSKRFWTKVTHISRVQETSWNAGFVSRFQASKAWVFPVCTWPVSHPFTSCHRVFECFKGSLLTWKRTRPLTCAALKLDTCLMSCVKSFEALRRITIPKSIALCAILHQITASEEICLECHANTSLHVFAAHIFFTRPRLLSKWNWAKGLLIVHNAQFVWSFVAKGLKMLYWKTYLKLLLVQYLQSSVCFLLASASGCPSYHLPLCVFHSAIPFTCRVMSPTHFRCLITSHQRRHRYSLGQLQLQSLHPTSMGPQGSHDKVRHTVSGCNAINRSISMKEWWDVKRKTTCTTYKKANNVSDCLMCASQKKYKFSQKLGQNNPYQHSKSFQGSLSGVRVSMIFARPCS